MQQPAPSATTQTNALAIFSLVFGLLGWTALPFLGCLIAIITGHLARGEIRNNPHMDGNGLAMTGLILGYLGILFSVAAVVFFLVFLGGMAYLSSMF